MKMCMLGALALGLAISGCSDGSGGSADTAEMAEPDIAPGAAPGVAFSYDYVYDLADDAIARV